MNPTSRDAYQAQFAAQTDIFKEQIITKEFYPKAVSDEFQKAVQRRASGGGKIVESTPTTFDPFAVPVPQQQPAVFTQPVSSPIVTMPAAAPIYQPQPLQSALVENPFEVPVIQQQQQQPEVDAQQVEVKKLITAMQKFLKSCVDVPATVGELSAKIKTITGQAWGSHWEPKYGSLANFLKAHPEAFTVVKNKYVVVAGQEELAMRQLDKDAGLLNPPQQQQPAQVVQQPNPLANVSLAQQQQYYQQQQQQQMYNNQQQYGNGYGQQQQPGYNNQGYYQPPVQPQQPMMMMPPTQQTTFFSPVVTANKSMFDQQQQPPLDYGFQQQQLLSSHRDSSADWMAFGVAGTFDPFAFNNTATTDFSQQQQGGSSWNLPADVGGFDEWGFGNNNNNTSTMSDVPDPLSNFGGGGGGSTMTAEQEEAEKAARKAARKAEKKAQKEAEKLAEEDEKLARKLQEEEYSKAGAKESEWVTLSVSEMRDLAEKELGKDNVRIIAGFTVKKMGREGRPHQRKMWITASLTHLAWSSSLLDGSHRGVELRQVTDIVVGQMTHTISRNTSDKAKVRALCFSLVTTNRTLDLQACSVIQRDTLVAALQSAVDFNKKYRPVKVDRYHTKIQVPSGTVLPIPIGGATGAS